MIVPLLLRKSSNFSASRSNSESELSDLGL